MGAPHTLRSLCVAITLVTSSSACAYLRGPVEHSEGPLAAACTSLTAPPSTWRLVRSDSYRYRVPDRFITVLDEPQYEMHRTADAELSVWNGGKWNVPAAGKFDRNTCELEIDGRRVTIVTSRRLDAPNPTRINRQTPDDGRQSTRYLVTAHWNSPVNGREVYVQLATPYAREIPLLTTVLRSVLFEEP